MGKLLRRGAERGGPGQEGQALDKRGWLALATESSTAGLLGRRSPHFDMVRNGLAIHSRSYAIPAS